MKVLKEILKELRTGQDLSSNNTPERKAVIVKIKVSARKFTYGVQFWKIQDIKKGFSQNNLSFDKAQLVELY